MSQERAEAVGIGGVKVVHAVPGRVRVKISRVKSDTALAQRIQERLSAVEGIQRVDVNPITGSVLVLYDSTAIPPFESLSSLMERFIALFPDTEWGELDASMAASSNGAGSGVSPAEELATFVGGLNAKLGEATGGFDLKFLLPLSLFLLGLRGLLITGKGVFPTWYDLLWFSFGTFLMLNPDVGQRRR
jgi:hypothetical protein